MRFEFTWDPRKAAANLRKHRVSFDEAMDVFRDPQASTSHDAENSVYEDRWVSVGASDKGRILVVVFVEEDGKIRFISARRATRRERNEYEEEWQ